MPISKSYPLSVKQSPKRSGRLLGAAVLALSLGLLAGRASAQAQSSAHQPQRPNFLVILADDLGYSDVGAFGGDIDTPNLDTLAAQSVKMTSFYNMARCTPSRASLLTGRYPHRIGMGEFGKTMDRTVPTIAEELRGAGYATDLIGKWHLTEAITIPDKDGQLKWLNHQADFDRDFADRSTYPVARGFDHHYGIVWGVADYYDPFSLVEDYTPVKSVPKDYYITNDLTDHAVADIQQLSKGSKPFFMYLAYTAPHWPLQAPESVIKKYLPRYAGGWDAVQKERYVRQVRLGLIDSKATPMPALEGQYYNQDGKAWADLSAEEKAIEVRKMATHAAMVDIMDQGIGRVIDSLKASGQYENTVILFMSDNGASPEVVINPGYDRPSETRDGRKIQYGQYQAGIGSETTMAGIGAYWASAVNTPWRYWKAESYDGGIRTPFLISWAGHMQAGPGTVNTSYGDIIDITPTLLDIAGVAPTPWKAPIDGVSIAGVLAGKQVEREQPLYFEHQGGRAIFVGKWKLASQSPQHGAKVYAPWKLYDMTTDASEMRDVSAEHPELAAELAAKWTAWATEMEVTKRQEP